ncbi:isochorismatase family protein [Chitinibacter bivalviorum]|uniref:Isochorismatase family protein n=1 Tax=Chitinibacter bivalviorum TaxID=2739434 RepID=A0A7H9BFV8_9NEIS|nr:isochorismatase family protein [Chitinibacter bivalviorum]QLG87126.1 isochorismatase family protein [Chitinibacter bivalviorum]
MSAALLLIDIQQSFEHRPYWSDEGLAQFQQHVLALVAGCQAAGVPVVNILHTDNDDVFRKDSGLVKPMTFLSHTPAATFEKRVHNALTESGLLPRLNAQQITRLIVCGIRTEQCCETTTRVASDLGFAVDFVTEATLTFAMQYANGTRYSADEIKARTELVLADRFARICTVNEVLTSLELEYAA